MGAQPELETHLKYCFQSSKGLVQVRVPLFWFGPLGLGSGFVRERVPVQVRLRTQTPRGGGFADLGHVGVVYPRAGACRLGLRLLPAQSQSHLCLSTYPRIAEIPELPSRCEPLGSPKL